MDFKNRRKDSLSRKKKSVRAKKKTSEAFEDKAESSVPVNTKKGNNSKPSIAISGRKIWLFRILAVIVIPSVLFLLVETGLRLVGFGYPTSLAIRYKDKNFDSYHSNIKFSWLYFDPKIARAIDPFMFPVKKSAETYMGQ